MRPITFLAVTMIACAACEFRAPPTASAPEPMAQSKAPSAAPIQEANAGSEPAPRVAMPPPQALTDAAITRRISSELRADPGMAGADVSVNTDKGVVVLSGTVKSFEQTGIASAYAQAQDGVLRVDNQLRPALS